VTGQAQDLAGQATAQLTGPATAEFVGTGSERVDARMVGTWTALEQGTLVAGRYRLLRPLGSGGSAQVWAARDESLGREVALKMLSEFRAQGGHERERFEREARLLAALNHPRITTVFDFAEIIDERGIEHPFLVTELLEGESLSARLKRGPLPAQEALTVCGQIADALASAHQSGVVHRDVKPGNVMLTPRGAVLLDFGISRREADVDLTGQVLIGTPACMAPEQWRGSHALPASDVYALGCLIFWCLSGHAPYQNRDLPALGMAHLMSDAPALPKTGANHAEINAIYHACLRKEPAERPSASHVASVLTPAPTVEMLALASPGLARRTPGSPGSHRFNRHTRVATYVATVGATLAAAIVIPLTQADEGSATTPTSTSTGAPVSTSSTPSAITVPSRPGAATGSGNGATVTSGQAVAANAATSNGSQSQNGQGDQADNGSGNGSGGSGHHKHGKH
jgi:serine/threonine-protein kinase